MLAYLACYTLTLSLSSSLEERYNIHIINRTISRRNCLVYKLVYKGLTARLNSALKWTSTALGLPYRLLRRPIQSTSTLVHQTATGVLALVCYITLQHSPYGNKFINTSIFVSILSIIMHLNHDYDLDVISAQITTALIE